MGNHLAWSSEPDCVAIKPVTEALPSHGFFERIGTEDLKGHQVIE